MSNVSCEDLEKMSAKRIRELKRARQFALPKITKQFSPRSLMNDTSHDMNSAASGKNRYQTFIEVPTSDKQNAVATRIIRKVPTNDLSQQEHYGANQEISITISSAADDGHMRV